MGRTRTASPSDMAREVFEVPKSRPNRTGRQLSVAHGGPPKPSLRDGGPPGLRPVPHRAGALGGPAVRTSAPLPSFLGIKRRVDNGIDRLLDISVASARRPVYVISIAAGLAGCHPRTLRIYEEEGLLDPVRTDTNIRLYSDEDLERVRAIRYLTQTRGVNLAGVKMLLQLRDAADLLDEIANELDRADAERASEASVLSVADEGPGRKPRNRQRRKGVEL